MKTSEFTRTIWLWLLNEGGFWTAAEIARKTEKEVDEVFNCLTAMSRSDRNLVKKQQSPHSRRLVYGVDGTCLVPCGLALAEVQAP